MSDVVYFVEVGVCVDDYWKLDCVGDVFGY